MHRKQVLPITLALRVQLLAVAVARARKRVVIGYKTGEQSELVRFFAPGTFDQVEL